MLSIFSKKNFLVDHLEGFIDMHNHILPGIDDGAKNINASIELIKTFGEFGVKDFICTPHIMDNYYPNTFSSINESMSLLKNALKMYDFEGVTLRPAAEHMIDANFENLLSSNAILPLNHDHLLVEMSYLQPSINFDIAVKRIRNKQFFVVLAHPERYVYFHSDFKHYQSYKAMGVLFQMNLLSIGGYYGKRIQKITLKLLEEGMYDFVGTDVHHIRHLNFLKKHTKLNDRTMDKILSLIINTITVFQKK